MSNTICGKILSFTCIRKKGNFNCFFGYKTMRINYKQYTQCTVSWTTDIIMWHKHHTLCVIIIITKINFKHTEREGVSIKHMVIVIIDLGYWYWNKIMGHWKCTEQKIVVFKKKKD